MSALQRMNCVERRQSLGVKLARLGGLLVGVVRY